MIPELRQQYNESFTNEKYESFLQELNAAHPGQIEFRVAETPIFVPKDFTQKMLHACESIIDIITDPQFKTLTKNAIPPEVNVPGEDEHPQCIAFYFGVQGNVFEKHHPIILRKQTGRESPAFRSAGVHILQTH